MSDRHLLALSLEAAIPLYVAELERLPEATRLRIARYGGEVLACYGDVLQYRRPRRKKGGQGKTTAEVFNAVARGLAAAKTLGHDIDRVLRDLQGCDRS